MPRPKQHKFYVIFFGPQQHFSPGTKYYDKNAKVTDIKTKAARFITFEDAQEFANENNIELNAVRYIEQETFSDSEL